MDETGISKSTIVKMVHGEQVSMDILDRLCNFLECDIEEIIEVIAKTNHLYNVDKTIDFDRVALLVLNDIRSGRLGKITLDRYSNE